MFEAHRAAPSAAASRETSTPVPQIGGLWQIQLPDSKVEPAWNFVVRQSGAEVSGAILRLDGDTGDSPDVTSTVSS